MLEAEGKPVHLIELEAELKRLDIKFTHRSLMQRMHELIMCTVRGYQPVYRVGPATYALKPNKRRRR